ncbi:MAG: ATP-binding protein [Arcobacteraceae bacterium]
MTSYQLSNIHNNLDGYNKLFNLYDTHKEDIFETLELQMTEWFDANLSAVLGAILDRITNDGLNTIEFKTVSSNIQKILQKNSFLEHYGFNTIYDTYNTTIKYLKLKTTDSRYFNDYVENDLLSRNELPKMSEAVHEKIGESIHEMFINAKIHSETEFIYTCGQFFPRDNNLNFTIVDSGIGFAKRIEKNLGYSLSSKDAIKWAMEDGHTTKQNVSGGIGLALLKEFILQNKGKIQIISGDAFYELSNTIVTIQQLKYYFDGSIISMTFKTNDTVSYLLADEINSSDIF